MNRSVAFDFVDAEFLARVSYDFVTNTQMFCHKSRSDSVYPFCTRRPPSCMVILREDWG